MKELDKAIVNDDIKQIVFLIKNGVDCTGAVLIHLKDALIPEHFTEEHLVSKGALLTMDALKLAVPTYFQKSQTEYRYETYIKRLYFGVYQLLQAWKFGSVQNQEYENHFNQLAIQFLKAEWIANTLPDTLAKFASSQVKDYIDTKVRQWKQQSLSDKNSSQLDKVVLDALMSHWYLYQGDSENLIIKKIRENQRQQLVEFYKHSKEDDKHFVEINQSLCKKTDAQIGDGSINEEEIRDAVLHERDLELKGVLKFDTRKEFEKGVRNLFVKWRAGELDAGPMEDVGRYVQKQLQDYTLPSELKDTLVKAAIEQLLRQYRQGQLSELQESLEKQFNLSINHFYSLNTTQESSFRDELVQEIFSKLLRDWKYHELNAEAMNYLQANLLTDIYGLFQQLNLFRSPAMSAQITQLQQEVNLLKQELNLLKQELNQLRANGASSGLSTQGIFRQRPSTDVAPNASELEADPEVHDEQDMTVYFIQGMKN